MDDFEKMDAGEKERRLCEELTAHIDRFAGEYDLTYPQILGVLTVIQHGLIRDFFTDADGKDQEGTEDD